jgi:outer membrane protein OmpA-like peptidoglycan-associated protein
MKKNIIFFVLLLLCLSYGVVFAETLPIKLPSYCKIYESRFQPYGRLYYYDDGEYKYIYGKYWKIKYKIKEKKSVKEFYDEISSLNKHLKLANQKRESAKFNFTRNNINDVVLFRFYGSWGESKILINVPYEKILEINTEKPLTYNKNIRKKVPNNKFLPRVKGYHITRAEYLNYNKLDLHYKDPLTHSSKKTVEGNYWLLDYRKIKGDNYDHRYQIANNYIDEIMKNNGRILKHDGGGIIFYIKDKSGEYYGKVNAYAQTFNIKLIKSNTFRQSLIINPNELKEQLDKTGKVTLEGIYFDFNKAILKPESQKAIDAVVVLMKKYPDLIIEIQGHTDSVGSEKSNLILSEKRANAVKTAIIKGGIESKRLVSKGYGESKPVVSNDTDEGRAKNRRVELHKISGGDKAAIITIDFIKPMPNAKLVETRKYKNESFSFKIKNKKTGKYENKNFEGNLVIYKYHILKTNGKINTEIGRLEIAKNYENALKLLGATNTRLYQNNVYFYFDDRGDGSPLFGIIDCYDGYYYVKFYITENLKNGQIDKTPIKN